MNLSQEIDNSNPSSIEHEGGSFSDPPPNHFVLCGRGERTNRHPGNKTFRRLVDQNRSLYHSGTKKRKGLIATSIVRAIHCQDQPGRFVRQDKTSRLWIDVGMKQAIKKTSQALREIAPEKKNNTKKDEGDRYNDQSETDDEQHENEDKSQDGNASLSPNRNVIFSFPRGPFKFFPPTAVSFEDGQVNSEGDGEENPEDDEDYEPWIVNIDFFKEERQRSFESLKLSDECPLRRPVLTFQTSDFTFGSVSSFFEGNDSTVP